MQACSRWNPDVLAHQLYPNIKMENWRGRYQS